MPGGRLLIATTAMKQAFQERTGQELLPGTDLLPLLSSDRHESWRQRLAQALEGQRLRFEVEETLGGARATLDISLNPILGQDGRPVEMTFFSHDITARKQAEERLGERQRRAHQVHC